MLLNKIFCEVSDDPSVVTTALPEDGTSTEDAFTSGFGESL